MNRLVIASGTVLALALAVGMQACSSSGTGGSTPTSTAGTGNTSSAGTGNSTAGGSPGASGSSAVAGTGGTLSGTGGTVGAGGTAAAGTGGTAPAGGAGGSSPTAGAGGSSAGAGGGSGAIPTACDATVAKAGACTTEGSVCSKTCGPDKAGYKTETCTASAYAEGVCTYPPGGNYACYKKTLPLVACAGAATAAGPVASSACTADPCVPCGPAYQDSKMTAKMGACVCTANKWSCASDADWPPQ